MKLEALIGEALRKKRLFLGVAESCTGGLLSSIITDVAGSSIYFKGGIVAYDNAVKRSILGVKASTLSSFGAVSRETAREMALGARKTLKADISAAITGIAGPGGGTARKPAGLVFIAISKGKRSTARKFLFKGSRQSIKRQSAEAALKMIAASLGIKANSK